MDGNAFKDGGAASLADRAYRSIEEMIVTEQLPPGQVLSEASLSDRLGIGRTPVREALQRLASEGLILVLPRRGVMVSEFGVEDCLLLLEVRRAIERLVVRNAARLATVQEREAFRASAAEFAEAQSETSNADLGVDMRFNALLFTACRNPFAARSLQAMSGLFRRFWFQKMRSGPNRAASIGLHHDLAAAIASGDVDRSVAACDALLDHIERVAREALG